MKWTTYDGTPETLPKENVAVLIAEEDGSLFVGTFGEGVNKRNYLHTVVKTWGIMRPGDRWIPVSAIAPERLDATQEVLSLLRTALEGRR